jgi:hypothetical protein
MSARVPSAGARDAGFVAHPVIAMVKTNVAQLRFRMKNSSSSRREFYRLACCTSAAQRRICYACRPQFAHIYA